MFFERSNPTKAIVWIIIEMQKTGLRPTISAALGKINAAIVQPIKREDPMKPTEVFEAHARSNCSNML